MFFSTRHILESLIINQVRKPFRLKSDLVVDSVGFEPTILLQKSLLYVPFNLGYWI